MNDDKEMEKRDPYGLKYNLLHLLFWAVVIGVAFGMLILFGD